MSELVVELETPLPERLHIGKGNVLFLRGRCYHPDEHLKSLAVTIDGKAHPTSTHSLAAPEVLDGTVRVDPNGHVLVSKFWASVPVARLDADVDSRVGLEAKLRDGRIERRELGSVCFVAAAKEAHASSANLPELTVCLATSDPDVDEVGRAMAAAPDAYWVVVDDHSSLEKYNAVLGLDHGSAWQAYRNEKRLGPVRTIERALGQVSDEAQLVAVVDTSTATRLSSAVQALRQRGAAAAVDGSLVVFRASLLEDILPFPPDVGAFDVAEWIATVASTRGEVVSVGENRIPQRSFRMSRAHMRSALVSAVRNAVTFASLNAAQAAVFATAIQLRAGRRRPRWNGVQPLVALATTRLLTAAFQVRGSQLLERRASAPDRVASLDAYLAKIEHDMAPLRLDVTPNAPVRLNVVVPMIDFRYVFGAYLTIFHLLVALRSRGIKTRLLIVQERPVDQGRWRSELQRYPGLENLLDHVEVEDATDRSRRIEVNAADTFLATTSWTAHVASAAAKELGRERFAFLVLEYDPLVHPTGSVHELSARAYDLPHDAIFSTDLLRRYFRENALGVFKSGGETVAVDNPIETQELNLAGRTPRGLLFYARPEEHAARNLFEIGVLALRRVAAKRAADLRGWRIDGIGSLQPFTVALGEGLELNVLQRVPLDRYLETLESYDVGIALQATPHPGLVALDMAAAGLVTVTNSWATKHAEDLTKISPNLIAPEPTIEGVAHAIEEALDRASDTEARVRGSNLNWPRTWDDALGPQLDQILAFPSLQPR